MRLTQMRVARGLLETFCSHAVYVPEKLDEAQKLKIGEWNPWKDEIEDKDAGKKSPGRE